MAVAGILIAIAPLMPMITRLMITAFMLGKGWIKHEDIDPETGLPKVMPMREDLLASGATEEDLQFLGL